MAWGQRLVSGAALVAVVALGSVTLGAQKAPAKAAPAPKGPDVVAVAALQPLLPKMDGWTRGTPGGSVVPISDDQGYSFADAEFTNGEQKVKVTIGGCANIAFGGTSSFQANASPAGAYLDVIAKVKDAYRVPTAVATFSTFNPTIQFTISRCRAPRSVSAGGVVPEPAAVRAGGHRTSIHRQAARRVTDVSLTHQLFCGSPSTVARNPARSDAEVSRDSLESPVPRILPTEVRTSHARPTPDRPRGGASPPRGA